MRLKLLTLPGTVGFGLTIQHTTTNEYVDSNARWSCQKLDGLGCYYSILQYNSFDSKYAIRFCLCKVKYTALKTHLLHAQAGMSDAVVERN